MHLHTRSVYWGLALGMAFAVLQGDPAFAGQDSWTRLGPSSLSSNQPIRAIAVDPTDSLKIYAGNDSATVYSTTNGGTSWSVRVVDPTRLTLRIKDIRIVPTATDSIYVVTDSGWVFVSANAGVTWTALSSTGLVSGADTLTGDFVLDVNDHATIYVATNRGVYKSTNKGVTSWFPVNNGLGADSSSVSALTIDETNPNILYMGTHSGRMYRSDNGGGALVEFLHCRRYGE